MRSNNTLPSSTQTAKDHHQSFLATQRVNTAELSDVTMTGQRPGLPPEVGYSLGNGSQRIEMFARRQSPTNISRVEINDPFTGLVTVPPSRAFTITTSLQRLAKKLDAERADYRSQLKELANDPTSLLAAAIDNAFTFSDLVRGGKEVHWKVPTPTAADPDADARVTLSRRISSRDQISYNLKIQGSTQQVFPIEVEVHSKELAPTYKDAERSLRAHQHSSKLSGR